MAALKDIAKEYKEEIMEGIAFVAVWKKGRSWNATAFWLDPDTDKIAKEDVEDIKAIIKEDAKAVFVNEYYNAHMGEGKIDDIVNGIRWTYENAVCKVEDYLPETEHKWIARIEVTNEDGKLDTVAFYECNELKKAYKVSLQMCRDQKGEAIAEIYEDVELEEIGRTSERYTILKGENGLIFLTERNHLGEMKKSCRIREEHTEYTKLDEPTPTEEEKTYRWTGRTKVMEKDQKTGESRMKTLWEFADNDLKKVYKDVLKNCKYQHRNTIGEIHKNMSMKEKLWTQQVESYVIIASENSEVKLIAIAKGKIDNTCRIRKKKYQTRRKEKAKC